MRILFLITLLVPQFILAQKDSTLLFKRNFISFSVFKRYIFNENASINLSSSFAPTRIASYPLPNVEELCIGASAFVYKDYLEAGISFPVSRKQVFNGNRYFEYEPSMLNTGYSLGFTYYPFGIKSHTFYPNIGCSVNKLSTHEQNLIGVVPSVGSSLRWKTNVLDLRFLYVLNNRFMEHNSRFQHYWFDIGLRTVFGLNGKTKRTVSKKKYKFYILSGIGIEIEKDPSPHRVGYNSNDFIELTLGVQAQNSPIYIQLSTSFFQKDSVSTKKIVLEIQRSFFNTKKVQPYLGVFWGVSNSNYSNFYAGIGGSGGLQIVLNQDIVLRSSFKYLLKIPDFEFNNRNAYLITPFQLLWRI